MRLSFTDRVRQYFHTPEPIFLKDEAAVGYVLSVLLTKDSYGTELIAEVEATHAPMKLSDTALYSALKQLEAEGFVSAYWKKVEGRGRPRRMYQLINDRRQEALELAKLWEQYRDRRLQEAEVVAPVQ